MNETDLLHMLIARAPYDLPDMRIFRRNVLNVATTHGFRARNGVAGQADAYALLRGGRHLEIETKAHRGALGGKQKNWRAFCADFGVPHIVLRQLPNEEPEATVARWIDGLGEVAT